MLRANKNHNAHRNSTAYATSADFCRIFESDMNRLYLLAFLLTTDHVTAEKCFVLGLEDSKNGNLVFKDWAESWARRSIIANAIRMIHPAPATRNGGHISPGMDPNSENTLARAMRRSCLTWRLSVKR